MARQNATQAHYDLIERVIRLLIPLEQTELWKKLDWRNTEKLFKFGDGILVMLEAHDISAEEIQNALRETSYTFKGLPGQDALFAAQNAASRRQIEQEEQN
jgi:hypothetical protein